MATAVLLLAVVMGVVGVQGPTDRERLADAIETGDDYHAATAALGLGRSANGPGSALPCRDGPQYKCVLNDAGVLDAETGLVWRRGQMNADWSAAATRCTADRPAAAVHWRLPDPAELLSLTSAVPASAWTTTGRGASYPLRAPRWVWTNKSLGRGPHALAVDLTNGIPRAQPGYLPLTVVCVSDGMTGQPKR